MIREKAQVIREKDQVQREGSSDQREGASDQREGADQRDLQLRTEESQQHQVQQLSSRSVML